MGVGDIEVISLPFVENRSRIVITEAVGRTKSPMSLALRGIRRG